MVDNRIRGVLTGLEVGQAMKDWVSSGFPTELWKPVLCKRANR